MTTSLKPTEQVVLLDESGRSIGSAPKHTVHTDQTPLHLAFSCYVFDEDNRFLLTQRAMHKTTWGGVWTNSCCGHPAPGEDIRVGVQRRVSEELGLELTGLKLLLPGYRYRVTMANGIMENEMCPVFVATTDTQPRLDPEEVAASRWMPWQEFRRDVLAGTLAISPWCVDQVRQLPEDPRAATEASESLLPPAAATLPR